MIVRALKRILARFLYILEIFDIVILSIELFFIKRKERRVIKPIIFKQIAFTGMYGLKIIGTISIFIGIIILLLVETVSTSIVFDKTLLGKIMTNVVLQEIAPLLTGIIVIGRSATAIAAEIANMSVNNEILALESLGIDPIHFIVTPRVIGITVSMFFLVLYFFFISAVGGFIFSKIVFGITITTDEYIDVLFSQMSVINILFAVLKGIFFGLFISSIACYKGLNVEKSINLVPVVITQTVVASLIAVIVLSLYFAILLAI